MKNMLKNKKGFTLVELLAVIVILALLIVITANTVLPMMSKNKKNGLATYAGRVINTAAAEYQSDAITSGTKDAKYYSVKAIMGESSTYFGCVKVTPGDSYKYSIAIFNPADGYAIVKNDVTGVNFAITDVYDGDLYNDAVAADKVKKTVSSTSYEITKTFNTNAATENNICTQIGDQIFATPSVS